VRATGHSLQGRGAFFWPLENLAEQVRLTRMTDKQFFWKKRATPNKLAQAAKNKATRQALP